MTNNLTNDQLDAKVEEYFLTMIESIFDGTTTMTRDDRTLLMAKMAARCATYAGDAINF